jgi:uncharacterized protein
MTEIFHHGARVLEKDIGYRPIQTTDTSTIGLMYTAPDADPELFPLNKPQLFLGDRDMTAQLGAAGTGKDAFDGIYDQGVAPAIVGIRVAQGQTIDQTLANLIGDYSLRTGVHALYSARNTVFKTPKILIAPGFTQQRVTGGITQIVVGSGGAGYTTAAVVINGHGYGGGAKAVAIIRNGVITGIQMLNSGIGYDAQHATVAITGDGANATIQGFQIGSAANPVVAELGGIANRLRATIIADCPNATAEQSIAYRNDWNSRRIYCVDNHPLVGVEAISQPPSARVAGLLAAVDNNDGFWFSPSNRVIQGIVGTSRPIDDSGVGGESDYLNQNDVATIVHRGSGYKLWGNHGATSDTLWKMFSAGRTVDTVYDSIEVAIDDAYPGRPLNLQFYEGVCDSVNEKLRYYKSFGAILGGKIWVDPAKNPPGQLVLGKPKFNMNIEPVGVAEDIQIEAQREPGYYKDLIDQVVLNLTV